MPAPLTPFLLIATWPWIVHFRLFGLIAIGIADNSVIPMPGSMDALTIYFAASDRKHWYVYAIIATFGALLGGSITYALARKGGKEALERKLSARRVNNLYRRFEQWGFWAVALPAMLPPPFPIVPFLLAAGAFQYPQKKFLGALALGRGLRFLSITLLAVIYGTQIVTFFSRYYLPAMLVLIGMSLAAAGWAVLQFYRQRRRKNLRTVARKAA